MVEQIKKLRELTSAPLKDCKEALEKTGGDLDQAQQYLREQGILKAAKKADRETNEGIVVVKTYGSKTVGLKLLCETDFVAKNENFRELASLIVDTLAESSDVDSYDALDTGLQQKIQKHITDNALKIGENMQIAQVLVTTANAYSYTHPGDKVAAVVYYSGDAEKAKDVALQVAAMNPQYFDLDSVPADLVAELTAQAKKELEGSGKALDIVDKIVAGKVSKQLAEHVLMEQEFIKDSNQKVKDMLGSTVVTGFVRFSVK